MQSSSLQGEINPDSSLIGEVRSSAVLYGEAIGTRGPKGDKGDPGTTIYSELSDKPQIEGITLEGNKTFEDLGLTIDEELLENSSNPIMNKAVFQAIQNINYIAGNGIIINNRQIMLDDLILDCGTSTTVI